MSYAYQPFDYHTPPELAGGKAFDAPVLIVGAGPIGLTAAIDLALHGIKSIILDDNNVVSIGSRAICWSKRTLEIFDRLGVGERMVEKGVTWKIGRVYSGEDEVFNFDLLPEDGHKMPAFINLQQYYVEEYLIDRVRDFPDLIDLRFKNRVTALHQHTDGKASVEIDIKTPDGDYTLGAKYLLACDGANSDIRTMMGLRFEGQSFEEQFLIADIHMQADFPNERWFWFNPPFHEGQTALLHKQPDDIYRIDLQLDLDVDVDAIKNHENLIPRIKKAVGGRPFELDWVSVYKFRCNRMERFVHDRVIFVGDSAHVVSPFGARGGNGGIHDVDNLVWKLALVLKGKAQAKLLESYNQERIHGADENLWNSTQTTNFMQPSSPVAKIFRQAVIDMASHVPFGRQLLNPGRLSVPCVYENSSLNMARETGFDLPLGSVCVDAPVKKNHLLDFLQANQFYLLGLNVEISDLEIDGVRVHAVNLAANKNENPELAERYLSDQSQAVYLIRPDQHIAAIWKHADTAAIKAGIKKILEGVDGQAEH